MYANAETIYKAAIKTIDIASKHEISDKGELTESSANRLFGAVVAVCEMVNMLEREGS